MAFGIKRSELESWKKLASKGEVAFITHYWYDERFPDCTTVTKAACSDLSTLIKWGQKYGLKKEWIHYREWFPHFDLLGEKQLYILKEENKTDQIARFQLESRV
ncbi:hypothetical protein [Alteribacillus iranensis]|uniref:YneQ n=1 Tax=Alteribacillus iranensis TaxID=930128 RepID=A0A1I1ZZG1_9BACI|nr:hypothetical protein [Alteribacillus iranensis]SFE37016.1 hypothetical protein SAMN05192532_101552 [Alteribacillus iranensis]